LAQFLPPEYVKLATGGLKEFFPESFDIDLNGRTLPWEAAILIPFADEDLFIRWESILFEEGMRLTQEEAQRNSISFIFPSYHHDKTKKGRPLKSTLRSMRDLPDDLS
jgi:5'-3' exonuclease